MTTWICGKCKTVTIALNKPDCCGEVDVFNLIHHGESLIPFSNSWIGVWEKWKNNPLLKEIGDKLADEGCYGASSALNAFIEELWGEYREV
jgi:hypothetical protein